MTTYTATLPISLPRLEEVRSVVRAHAAICDYENRFPSEAVAALRASRLMGLLVPSELGGIGGTWQDVAVVTQLLARDDLSVALIFAMHCQQTSTVARHASGGWAKQLLARIADGDCLLASVTTDPQTGSDPLRPASTVARKNGQLQLRRVGPVVTAGLHADGFLVTMRDSETGLADATSLVYADRSQLTVEQLGHWQAMGMRATQSVPLRLTGDLPDEQIVGEAGRFREVAIRTFLPLAHIGWAAAWLGAAAGALSRTVIHLRQEGRSAKALPPDLKVLRLGTARSYVDTVHAVLRQTLHTVESLPTSTPSVQLALNNLKTIAAELTLSAVDNLIDLMGMRHGYMSTSPLGLERIHRDLRSATLTVSNDTIKLLSGRLALLDVETSLAW